MRFFPHYAGVNVGDRRLRCDWPVQNPPAPLETGDVHLWLAALNGSAREIDEYAALLSRDERERAARFLQPVDRDRFVMARGFLRTLLGAYTNADPRAVRFDYNPHGKPALFADKNPNEIQFNLSHSDDQALLAVTQNRPVGVDLERVAPDFDCRPLIRRFLSPSEQAGFDNLPPNELPEAWFRFWTIKEARAKAVGTGLAAALNPKLSASEAQWNVETFTPCSGYAAAVAVRGEVTNLVCRRWAQNT